jgi:hypothetical protein
MPVRPTGGVAERDHAWKSSVLKIRDCGEVSEWLKEHAWKACVPAMVPQVRILFSPPRIKMSKWTSLFLRTGFEPALLCSKSRKVRRSERSERKHRRYFLEQVNGGAEQSGAIPCSLHRKLFAYACVLILNIATLKMTP